MYFSRLDTVRCYAVLMVVFAHIFSVWTWRDSTKYLLPLGNFGVVVFFVLSGFLITFLLLKESKGKPIGLILKEFYIRRSLRIFPIYYLFLIVCYSVNVGGLREYGLFPWLYLNNIYVFDRNSWMGEYSHLWTLAVEEQFYLVWPFLILFLRKNSRLLLSILLGVVLVSTFSRFIMLNWGLSERQATVFPIANFDFFAFGALLALGKTCIDSKLESWGRPAVLVGVLLYYGSYYLLESQMFFVVKHLAMGITASGLVIIALYSKNIENVFHNRITMHLGKISYGIYLYHNFVIARYPDMAEYFGIAAGETVYVRAILLLLFIFLISELSFLLIEKPILRFKDRFKTI